MNDKPAISQPGAAQGGTQKGGARAIAGAAQAGIGDAGHPDIAEEAHANIDGVLLSVGAAGLKYTNRNDVALVQLAPHTVSAGCFTRSRCPSAAVDWSRRQIDGSAPPRALLINSGNANAFTGMKGQKAVALSARLVANACDIGAESVLLASTGVIGEPLAAEKYAGIMGALAANGRPDAWRDAAAAIMTTDTRPKLAGRRIDGPDGPIHIRAFAKGAGMIAPDMATMLGFVFTDAAIAQPLFREILSHAVRRSFNRITIDSDTSTSDTVLGFATQRAKNRLVSASGDPLASCFAGAMEAVCADLARQIVEDGEGATKFVEIVVTGATSDASAARIARSIANSPLVKTAIAGEDPNWGRVVMAVGKAGEPADRDRLSIWFGPHRVAVNGERDPDYAEAEAAQVMQNKSITIRTDLALGSGTACVWTCDLTCEYVTINSDYRS